MSEIHETWWSLISRATSGESTDRAEFAKRYTPVIRAYLAKRWRQSTWIAFLDDALQEVFVECLKPNGALERVDPERAKFRTYLYGIVRNVALRIEERHRKPKNTEPELALAGVPTDDSSLSKAFDREWARSIMKEAACLQVERAEQKGAEAVLRVEILRLRFQEGLPIRQVAAKLNLDATHTHRQYAVARKEFREALFDTVQFHHPGSHAEIEQECADLLTLLS